MLTQDELERERYEARRKAQLDYDTGLEAAHLEGRREGDARGNIKVIHFCERLLHLPQTSAAQLAALTLEELTRLAEELQKNVLEQRVS